MESPGAPGRRLPSDATGHVAAPGVWRWVAFGVLCAGIILGFGAFAHRSFREVVTGTFTAQQALFARSLEAAVVDHMASLERELRHVVRDLQDPDRAQGRSIPSLYRTHLDDFTALGLFDAAGKPLQLAPPGAGAQPEWLDAVRETVLGDGGAPPRTTRLSEGFHDRDGRFSVAILLPFALDGVEPRPAFVAGAARIEEYLHAHLGTWQGRSMGFVLADDGGRILSMLNTVHEIDIRMREGNLLALEEACLECHGQRDFEDVRSAAALRRPVSSLFHMPGQGLTNRTSVGFPVFNDVWTISIIAPFGSIQDAVDDNLRNTAGLTALALLLVGTLIYLTQRSVALRRVADTAAALRRSEDRLQRYARELEEANRVKDLFTDLVRHDLLNPVATAKGYAEVLRDGEADPARRGLFEAQVRSLDRLAAIIENAATISRLADTETIKVQPLDLGAVIRAAFDRHRIAFEKRGIAVDLPPAGGTPVVANPLLEELFGNLLSNAAKYSPGGGTVRVDILDRGPAWESRVVDRGEGIPPELRERAFERHERLGRTRTKGLGLGLAIVRRIAELHRGEVAIEDNPGGGTVVAVRLPKGGPEAAEPGS